MGSRPAAAKVAQGSERVGGEDGVVAEFGKFIDARDEGVGDRPAGVGDGAGFGIGPEQLVFCGDEAVELSGNAMLGLGSKRVARGEIVGCEHRGREVRIPDGIGAAGQAGQAKLKVFFTEHG
jgi:hypothetical protein